MTISVRQDDVISDVVSIKNSIFRAYYIAQLLYQLSSDLHQNWYDLYYMDAVEPVDVMTSRLTDFGQNSILKIQQAQ